jgi:drug/metabolite transporter (DMT)-like permease
LKATNAFFPSTWLYISPIIAMGLGALFNREQISVSSLVGSILVISGIVLPNLHKLKKRWLHKTASSAS